jgi:hypothetical protein
MNTTEKDKSRREAWLLMRARGKKRYVFVYGTFWGALFLVAKILVRALIEHKATDWGYLPIEIVVVIALGWGLYFWAWKSNERKYGPSLVDDRPV